MNRPFRPTPGAQPGLRLCSAHIAVVPATESVNGTLLCRPCARALRMGLPRPTIEDELLGHVRSALVVERAT